MTAPPTIWIVDDDDSVRRSLIRLIRSAGLHVRGFASARAFLDASPDGDGCLLLDLQMPDMDGLELMERLESLGAPRPIIILSANADLERVASARTKGAVDFLVKPVDDEVLLGCIRVAIDAIGNGASR